MGLLVLAHDTWTVAEVAERLRMSARVRVDCRADLAVFRNGTRLASSITVRQAGLQALECVHVRRNGPTPGAAHVP